MSVLRALTRDPFATSLRLGLLTLLLNPGIVWTERVPVLMLAGAGLVIPGLVRHPGLWAGLVLATGVRLVASWPLSDNHDYLTCLFCVAAAAALIAPDPGATLARSARLLLGLTFFFATLWKGVLSPDFVEGTFFRVTLLEDTRFANLAILVGGMDDDRFETNLDALGAHRDGVAWSETGFREPPASRRLALALTAFTLAIEGALALAFLWPGAPRVRDGLLVTFLATTFAFATVAGFGWLLATLGFAQCEPERTRTRLAYVLVFFAIVVYEWVPWSDRLVAWVH